MWEEDQNEWFTCADAQRVILLIELIVDYGVKLALLKGYQIHHAWSDTGNWTRPDNVFCTLDLLDALVKMQHLTSHSMLKDLCSTQF